MQTTNQILANLVREEQISTIVHFWSLLRWLGPRTVPVGATARSCTAATLRSGWDKSITLMTCCQGAIIRQS